MVAFNTDRRAQDGVEDGTWLTNCRIGGQMTDGVRNQEAAA